MHARGLRVAPLVLRALGLLLFALLSVACGEVQECRRGSEGCLRGPPREDGTCQAGLVPRNGTCSEPGHVSSPLSCDCEPNEVCTLDAYRCVNYCEPLATPAGSQLRDEAPTCEGDFAALCRIRCKVTCQQQADFCGVPGAQGSCDGPDVLAACDDDCAAALDPEQCMALRCSEARARLCRQVRCPGETSPRCDNVSCSNTCSAYNFDGLCDDGDLLSARSGLCPWGTDCADCGPRRGARPEPAAQGEPCAFHSGCAGSNTEDLTQADAWCVTVDAAANVTRCVPDCSDAVETCPDGSACFELLLGDLNGDGQQDPLEQNGLRASACFPVMCRD